MLTERDIEQAHPDAFDFAFGTLPSARTAWFNRHFDGCPGCQKVVAECSEIGQIIQILPPHVEPSADLEDRTVAAMVRALADQRAKQRRRTDAVDHTVTRLRPRPEPRRPSPRPGSSQGPATY